MIVFKNMPCSSCKFQGLLSLIHIWAVTTILLITASFRALFTTKKQSVRLNSVGNAKRTIAFFHPYCNAGGGGERVLWAAVRSLQEAYPKDSHHFVIFTGDKGSTGSQILLKAKTNFNISIDHLNVEFIFLTRRSWVEADPYPLFTLFGQSLGSLFLGLEALSLFQPDVFLDTMGYAFTLPLFKYLAKSRVGAYVHYPTISVDMVQRVAERETSFNNGGSVANSATLSAAKLVYYRIFAWMYTKAGRCSEVTMVNSSWTEAHILKLWQKPGATFKVYPPCDVDEFTRLERHDEDQDKRTINLVSVAQFRPEKNQALQIKAMKQLKGMIGLELWMRVRLVLLGSVRNAGDQERVDQLRKLAKDEGVEGNVIFQINCPFDTLKDELRNGLIGIHSMRDEHFGISVVECMAAGLLMIAHRSGGPRMDIVQESPESKRTGFLAETADEYANQIQHILQLNPHLQQDIRSRARSSVVRFSDEQFSKQFKRALEAIF